MGNVIRCGGGNVLIHQLLYHSSGIVQFAQVVLELGLLFELLKEGFPLSQLVKLTTCSIKQLNKIKQGRRFMCVGVTHL